MATVKKTLEEAIVYFHININCVDPLGRTALHIAIENENLEMIEVCLHTYIFDYLAGFMSVGTVASPLVRNQFLFSRMLRWKQRNNLNQIGHQRCNIL